MNFILIDCQSMDKGITGIALRYMVVCQSHLNELIKQDSIISFGGTTTDACYLCDKQWYDAYLSHLKVNHHLIEAIKPRHVVYIAGPMTGLPDHNLPAFQMMERVLLQTGCQVLSPAWYGTGEEEWVYSKIMLRDIKMLCGASHVVFLLGWEGSHGASLEHVIAETCDLGLLYENPSKPVEAGTAGSTSGTQSGGWTGPAQQGHHD